MLLLDTCALLWLVSKPSGLSETAIEYIRNEEGNLFISAISAVEISIKTNKKKLELPMEVTAWYNRALEFHGIEEIPVSGKIAIQSANLPLLHNDPCDRIIIATAAEHSMHIITCDTFISRYDEAKTIW